MLDINYLFTLYNSANFGVPQVRERVIILAHTGKDEIPFMSATHSEQNDNLPPWPTTRDAIWDLRNRKTLEHILFPEKRLKYYRLLKAGPKTGVHSPHHYKKKRWGKAFMQEVVKQDF